MSAALTAGFETLKPLAAAPKIAPSAADVASAAKTQGRAHKAAQSFESSFLSVMMNSMFEGLKSDGPFGGGEGEDAFRSLLTDAMAKSVTARGGIGLSATVERELLRAQGAPSQPAGQAASVGGAAQGAAKPTGYGASAPPAPSLQAAA